MSDQIMCCGEPVARAQSKTTGIVSIKCNKCGKYATGQSVEEAINNFAGTPAGANLPATPAALAPYAVKHMAEMAALTMPFIARDKPALTRLIKNNVRYIVIQSRDTMAAAWETKEGQESIVIALEEAMAIGAELGKTGSIVPFGSVVEFIPAVEAYEFALTNGSNPPFAWIQIDMIHKNDVRKISRINGEFSCSISPGLPRGELVGVAVYGFNNRLDHVIGEVYDADRLLKKAAAHSSSYKYFLRTKYAMTQAITEGRGKVNAEGREYVEVVKDVDNPYIDRDISAFEAAEKAGTLKKNGKGEYAETEIPKKGGGTWTKKIYRADVENPGQKTEKIFIDEVTNPYDGADQPEMLRKAAGKSFLGKYARVRGAEAAAGEMKGSPADELEKTIDDTIDAAFAVMDEDGDPQPPPAKPINHEDALKDIERAKEQMDEPMPQPEPEPPEDDNSLTGQFKRKVEAGKTTEKDELDIF